LILLLTAMGGAFMALGNFSRSISRFGKQQEGVAMIEAAFVLPILLAIVFGGIEFGMYFLKSNINANNVAATARAVQIDPSDESSRLLLSSSKLLSDDENVACSSSYPTFEGAQNGDCVAGQWFQPLAAEDLPEGQSAYYVLIKSEVASVALTGMFDSLLPANNVRQVINVSLNGASTNLHTCNGAPLLGKFCMGADRSQNADGPDDDYRLVYSVIGQPYCTSGGWSCQPYSGASGEVEPHLYDRCSSTQSRQETGYRSHKFSGVEHPFDAGFEGRRNTSIPNWCK
jgi:hypothetical protein